MKASATATGTVRVNLFGAHSAVDSLGNVSVIMPPVSTLGDTAIGDKLAQRDQGYTIIESNKISYSSKNGIYVGAARETVNRQLQEWRRQGILEMGRNRISLLKMNKLSVEARWE